MKFVHRNPHIPFRLAHFDSVHRNAVPNEASQLTSNWGIPLGNKGCVRAKSNFKQQKISFETAS